MKYSFHDYVIEYYNQQPTRFGLSFENPARMRAPGALGFCPFARRHYLSRSDGTTDSFLQLMPRFVLLTQRPGGVPMSPFPSDWNPIAPQDRAQDSVLNLMISRNPSGRARRRLALDGTGRAVRSYLS